MSLLFPSIKDIDKISVAIVVASLGGLAVALHALRKRRKGSLEERSTTSSAGGGALAYETKKAVDEYLLFHFGQPEDIFPYAHGPKEALDFAARCAQLCEKHCQTLQDFSGELGETVALDVGCAVGGSSFELARSFQNVLGVDYSQAFVTAAESMRDRGACEYVAQVEGDITKTCIATVPEDIPRSRAKFIKVRPPVTFLSFPLASDEKNVLVINRRPVGRLRKNPILSGPLMAPYPPFHRSHPLFQSLATPSHTLPYRATHATCPSHCHSLMQSWQPTSSVASQTQSSFSSGSRPL